MNQQQKKKFIKKQKKKKNRRLRKENMNHRDLFTRYIHSAKCNKNDIKTRAKRSRKSEYTSLFFCVIKFNIR